MDRWDGTAFDDRHKRLALGIIEPGPIAGHLAINQPIRIAGIKPHDPVAHNLQTHTADPGRIAAATAIVDIHQRQQPSALVRVVHHPCQGFQCRTLVSGGAKSARNPIAAPMAMSCQTCRHRFRLLALWESPSESAFTLPGIIGRLRQGIRLQQTFSTLPSDEVLQRHISLTYGGSQPL